MNTPFIPQSPSTASIDVMTPGSTQSNDSGSTRMSRFNFTGLSV